MGWFFLFCILRLFCQLYYSLENTRDLWFKSTFDQKIIILSMITSFEIEALIGT